MARHLAIAYGVVALVFLVLDALWLSSMTARLYRPAIGHLMQPGFAWLPAVIFYTAYAAGVVYFAVLPGLEAGSWAMALGRGALLGLLAYATYDLTNQATLRDWPWRMTIVDACWGAFATAMAAGAAGWATLHFAGALPAR